MQHRSLSDASSYTFGIMGELDRDNTDSSAGSDLQPDSEMIYRSMSTMV